jgi:phospholipid/cholesterol/gamma-HCH transport system ATP-binding protein
VNSLSGSAPELVAESVTKQFGPRVVLRDISLTIFPGEVVALVGGSGTGKTVLLDHLTGLMTPTRGRVLAAHHGHPGAPLRDLNAISSDDLDALRLHWAVVFQRNALFSGSVYENIAFWLREHTMLDEARIDARVRESLAAVALDVADVIRKDRDELSGGMAKRVAIARAIAIDPIVTFYDEPTTGLDPVIGNHIVDLIWSLHNRPRADAARRTTVIVTHDRELLRRMAPRVVMLDKGAVVFDGGYTDFQRCRAPAAVEYLVQMPVLNAIVR